MSLDPASVLNRELSWLEFNQRVLEEARCEEVPLLERLKFLAITASNLDEFFMVRVGGLQAMRLAGRRKRDASGMTPVAQLEAVEQRVRRMNADQEATWAELEGRLAEKGHRRVPPQDCDSRQAEHLQQLVEQELLSVFSPVAVALKPGPFPLIPPLVLQFAVRLRSEDGAEDCFALLSLAGSTGRFITLPADGDYAYMLLEDVVRMHLDRWFPGREIRDAAVFRVTRDADMGVREDEAPDLLSGMEGILRQRKISRCVRLEVQADCSRPLLAFLQEALGVTRRDIYPCACPVYLGDFMCLASVEGMDDLKDEPWSPQPHPRVDPRVSLFETLSEGDLVLHTPYQAFDPVVRLLEEAAADPDVLAIKQVLYRTSADSAVIGALLQAAERGKVVTVLVELKARFDEARNIQWARTLEQAGVQVVYGVRGLKTHAKACLIVRREPEGIARYLHLGTGNYNESTARLYGDLGLLTCNAALGAEVAAFFNAITGYSEPPLFTRLTMSPYGIRTTLLELIDGEIERCKQGQRARVEAKTNALVDPPLIEKLYEASRAGVDVRLNVRGICCLRPGLPGLSHNIRVVSIVDRYLEHSRIFAFRHGGEARVFIGSADLMPRNLDRRVELMTPIEDRACRKEVLNILRTYFRDNVKAHELQPDGSWQPVTARGRRVRSQEALHREACEAGESAVRERRTRFVPHLPPGQ